MKGELIALDDKPGESWQRIPGYSGRYEASDQGRVRRVSGKGCGDGKARLLRTYIGDGGYIRTVVIRNDGIRYGVGVHQLIAGAWLGVCPDGYEVNHIDLNKANNRPGNLQYLSHADNLRHARACKVWKPTPPRLGESVVQAVRHLLGQGCSQRTIAAATGVSTATVSHIRNRKGRFARSSKSDVL